MWHGLHRHRQTKIVATLGPSVAGEALTSRLFEAGVDVFRINFSHGSHDEQARHMAVIRALEARVDCRLGVIADLQGPKLRIGRFSGGRVHLQSGQTFQLDLNPSPGDARRVQMPHPEIFDSVLSGMALLLDDGKIRLQVERKHGESLICRVLVGGSVSDRKGVNVPEAALAIPALTKKDRADLDFALDLGVDFVGLSFVQRPADVQEAKSLIANRAGVIAKIEKPQALDSLDEILDISDAVMVARGDLGVELSAEHVPLVQRRIVRKARERGLPVIIATQMLESMVYTSTPTRAEASDVANAVFEGADAVMLSAETAAGKFPVEAVDMMDRIVTYVEGDEEWRLTASTAKEGWRSRDPETAIAAAASAIAASTGCRAIAAFTTSGATALRVARERPAPPILAVVSNEAVARRLAVAWGVQAISAPIPHSFDDAIALATQLTRDHGFARSGESIVVAAGMPMGTPGATNALRVVTLT